MKDLRYQLSQYKLSNDPHLLDRQNHITDRIREIIEELHPDVLKGRKYLLKKLPRLIEQYPKVPVFKNLLATVHQKRGETELAFKANRWLAKEHPDYLFGKLNLAAEYFENAEYESMPEVLGESLDLQSLYPHRDEFHIEEFIAFYQMAVLYFLSQDNIEQAEMRIDIMKEVAPDHVKTRDAEERYTHYIYVKAAERKAEQSNRAPLVADRRSDLQTTQPPSFHFPLQMEWLYEEDYDFPQHKLEKILELERKPLIEDLIKVLQDSILRHDYFEENYDGEDFQLFPIHAILLLVELKAGESLESFLELLKQDADFLEIWFGDFINEVVKAVVLEMGEIRMEELFNFLKLPNLYTFAKSHISEAIITLLSQKPELKNQILQNYRDLLQFYIEKDTDVNYADSTAYALIISDCMEAGFKELLPEIEQLYKQDLVALDVNGDFEKVEEHIQQPNFNTIGLKFAKAGIFEKYKIWKEDYENYLEKEFEDLELEDKEMDFFDDDFNFDEDDEDDDYFLDDFISENQPLRKEKEPGRNDPCPCGSGKKYKKCCMNKK
ncbi:DUF1186 domain-containing protein [Zunongwangia sp. F363]|uniref:DUF1186 domain-containing protein n=1 Tax=Autumnicola tepida TaxID=3075595 RepID=A0ABU3CCZ6_9FLAO|nr:DUF1186 domain-containing protein [Zunongwangia sp. F363]MDT0644097.1 DUF1186 domain-containing protein [Zunongwangia sp. F363]